MERTKAEPRSTQETINRAERGT